VGPDGWDVADAAIEDGMISTFASQTPGLVTAGCEPGLAVLERILREAGMAAVAATTSSAASLAALTAGRLHAAVVHGPVASPARRPKGFTGERFRLARWRVGLAGPADAAPGWWQVALSGKVPVVQREPGAAVQRTFEEAAGGPVPGPQVATHLEAARRAVWTGRPAVSIEPAALAVGAVFHPLDVHEAQMWVASEWLTERPVGEALNVIMSRRFQQRLIAAGGYDLSGCGTRVA
jgi:hypothetical protein